MHEIGIKTELIQAILDGRKTIEVRLGKPKFLKIQPGDILKIREDIWTNNEITAFVDDSLRVKVTQVLYFESFKELFEVTDFSTAIPNAKNSNEAMETYHTFYSTQDERKYGVAAFFIEPIK